MSCPGCPSGARPCRSFPRLNSPGTVLTAQQAPEGQRGSDGRTWQQVNPTGLWGLFSPSTALTFCPSNKAENICVDQIKTFFSLKDD